MTYSTHAVDLFGLAGQYRDVKPFAVTETEDGHWLTWRQWVWSGSTKLFAIQWSDGEIYDIKVGWRKWHLPIGIDPYF